MATGVYAVEIPVATVQSAIGAAYVVPVDRYAVVKVHVQDGEIFQINGVTVLASRALDMANVAVSASTTGQVTHVVSPNRRFAGQAWAANTQPYVGVNNLQAAVQANAAGDSGLNSPQAGPSGNVLVSTSAAAVLKTISGVEVGVQNTGYVQTFKLPSGSTISGGRYHAEIYKIPGSET